MQLISKVRHAIIPSLVLAWVLLGAVPAPATTVIRLPFENLVLDSDVIVRGQCVEKETRWVNGHLETTFQLAVEETLKGSLTGDMLDLTLPGGRTDDPIAMTQFIPQQPAMYKGERVVLFLNTKRVKLPADPSGRVEKSGTRLLTSPRIMGMWQGKFTILENPRTQSEVVTRYSLENLGYVPTDGASQRFHASLQRDLARHKNPPTEADLKSKNWDKELASGASETARRIDNLAVDRTHAPQTLGQIRAEQDVPLMMSYQELKTRVNDVMTKAKLKADAETPREADGVSPAPTAPAETTADASKP